MKPLVKVEFGDLPDDAKNLLTYTTQIDFTPWDIKAPRWFSAWARDEHGDIAGIFTIEFKYWFDGYVNVVVMDQRCMTKRTLRAIFTAAFSQARRLTAEVEPHNRRALRQVQRLGFTYEGMRRLGLEGARDVYVFGMLKNECRYLKSYVPPSEPPLDIAYRHLVDAVVRSDDGLDAGVGADRKNLGFSELGVGPGFTPPGGTFLEVGAPGRPAEMLGTDTARNTAGVRGVHFTRGHSVFGDANETVDFAGPSVMPHLRVAPLVDGERPEKTVVSGVGKRGGKSGFRGHNSSLMKV